MKHIDYGKKIRDKTSQVMLTVYRSVYNYHLVALFTEFI